MTDESFPAIPSVAEVPRVTAGSNCICLVSVLDKTDTVHAGRDEHPARSALLHSTLYTLTWEGHACHVVQYCFDSLSSSTAEASSLKKERMSLLFDQDVQAAQLYQHYSNDDAHILCAVVVTRDGRLWYGSLQKLETGTFPPEHVLVQVPLKQKLLGVNLIAVNTAKHCDGPMIAAVGDTLEPPQVVWLGTSTNGSDNGKRVDARSIPGLDHVHSPITAGLFLSKVTSSPAFWRILTRAVSSQENVDHVLVLGFANGAIRYCLIDESKVIQPVHLIGRLGLDAESNEQEVISVEAMANSNTHLIEAICYIGKNGTMAILDESSSFRRISRGLRLRGPWTSAALVRMAGDKTGVVATRHDGTTHLLVLLLDKDSSFNGSMRLRLPVRGDMTSVASCVSSLLGSWLAFGTLDGSVLLLHLDSNIWERLSWWQAEAESGRPLSILAAACTEQPRTETTTSRMQYLLRSMGRFEQMKTVNEKSSQQVNDDLERAMETTIMGLKITKKESSDRQARINTFKRDGTAAVQGTLEAGLMSDRSARDWTLSLHASCFEGKSESASSDKPFLCSRRCDHEDGGENPVYYNGLAVTESRAMKGNSAEHQIETTVSEKQSVDAFLSLANTTGQVDKQELQVGPKRRKASSLSAPCFGSASGVRDEALVLPL